MAINLQKGQKIEIGLTKMTIGLGWDPNEGTTTILTWMLLQS